MKNQRGFSLIEVMIAIAISSIITFSIFTVMQVTQNQLSTMDTKMLLQDNAREGLYKMTQEIRLSAPGHFSILDGGQAIEFDVPDAATPTNDAYQIDWDVSHKVRYELKGGQLLRILDGDDANPTVIANNVANLTFEGDQEQVNLITIDVGLQRFLANGRAMSDTPLQVNLNAELRNPEFIQEEEEAGEEGAGGGDGGSGDAEEDDSGNGNSDNNSGKEKKWKSK